jgi:ketosteroid isomerase-like protein
MRAFGGVALEVISVAEVDDFLGEVMPRLIVAESALHNGDVEPRLRMWSRDDPVTLFGAWLSDTGWQDVSNSFRVLASRFSDCTSFDIELVAAGASDRLAYTVAYEHTSASVEGVPRTYTLRVTQVYRREDGEWKLIHRHGDELATDQNS